jgi:hypothetical protein
MTIFSFKGYDNEGNLDEWTFGKFDMEAGLDLLTNLANDGWVLIEIKLTGIRKEKMITVPVDIIDGAYFSEPIQSLKLEWQTILFC